MTSTPILIFPSSSESFIVYCNSSKIFLQVVAYDTRQLKVHERNYLTHDLEMEAMVFVLKVWRYYLFCSRFEVFGDHKSLKYLFDHKKLNMRQRRWLEFLKNYYFGLSYHPSKANAVVHALSMKFLHISMLMVRELKFIEKFRDLSLVFEMTPNTMKLGMLKLTSGILEEIRNRQKLDLGLIDRLVLINQGKEVDFRLHKN